MAPKKRKAMEGGIGGNKKQKAVDSVRLTRNMTADSPRQAVIATAELLEQILLYLPAEQIFAAQRVSRQFCDLVATSAAIQQKLFLRPSASESLTWILRSRETPDDLESWLPPDIHFEVCEKTEPGHMSNLSFTPARLNPLLTVGTARLPEDSAQRLWLLEYDGIEGDPVKPVVQLQLRGKGSWRNTYFTDPPCQSVELHLRCILVGRAREVVDIRYCDVTDVNGLTLGAVIDAGLQNTGEVTYGTKRKTYYSQYNTVNDLMETLGESNRNPAIVDSHRTHFYLKGFVIPTDEEWEMVKQGGGATQKKTAH